MNFRQFLMLWSWLMAVLLENSYFGWHLKPETDAELVCDLLIIFMNLFMWGIWPEKSNDETTKPSQRTEHEK